MKLTDKKKELIIIFILLIFGISLIIQAIRITIIYYNVISTGHHLYTDIEMLHIWLDGSGTYIIYFAGFLLLLVGISLYLLLRFTRENDFILVT